MRITRFSLRVAVITVLGAGALTAEPAKAVSTPGLEREAVRLIAIDHYAFIAAKGQAPPPFDWSTDGCTRTPVAWARTFDQACQQHDFAYRNLGRGLRLRPTEAARAWVDRRLLIELRRVCAERFARVARARCRLQAQAMHAAVRLFNSPWS